MLERYPNQLVQPPLPPCPRDETFDFGPDEEWEPGQVVEETLSYEDGDIQITVSGPVTHPRITVRADRSIPAEEALWTGVYWAKEYGITGVFKETIHASSFDDPIGSYRLGGLYRYAGFELTARETNYHDYGETPYTPE